MKKLISATLIMCAAFSTAVFAEGEVNVVVNGNAVETKGIIVESTTLVPVRGVFEELGYEVSYDEQTKTATLTNSSYTVKMTSGDTVIFVNDEEITPPVPQQIVDGRFMLPLRTVSEAIGAEVEWDGETKTATITKRQGLIVAGIQTL